MFNLVVSNNEFSTTLPFIQIPSLIKFLKIRPNHPSLLIIRYSRVSPLKLQKPEYKPPINPFHNTIPASSIRLNLLIYKDLINIKIYEDSLDGLSQHNQSSFYLGKKFWFFVIDISNEVIVHQNINLYIKFVAEKCFNDENGIWIIIPDFFHVLEFSHKLCKCDNVLLFVTFRLTYIGC